MNQCRLDTGKDSRKESCLNDDIYDGKDPLTERRKAGCLSYDEMCYIEKSKKHDLLDMLDYFKSMHRKEGSWSSNTTIEHFLRSLDKVEVYGTLMQSGNFGDCVRWLKENSPNNHWLVVLLNTGYTTGEHWICLLYDCKKNKIELFNSQKYSPTSDKGFIQLAKTAAKALNSKLWCNSLDLVTDLQQDKWSCGFWVSAYVYCRTVSKWNTERCLRTLRDPWVYNFRKKHFITEENNKDFSNYSYTYLE